MKSEKVTLNLNMEHIRIPILVENQRQFYSSSLITTNRPHQVKRKKNVASLNSLLQAKAAIEGRMLLRWIQLVFRPGKKRSFNAGYPRCATYPRKIVQLRGCIINQAKQRFKQALNTHELS